MKKFLAMVLAPVMALSLVACGEQGDGHLRIIYGVFADRAKSFEGIDRICAALAKRAAELGITD